MKKVFLLSILTMLIAVGCRADVGDKVNSIQANELLQSEQEIVVLDVRTPREYEAGHVAGAVNIDVTSAEFASKISELDKDTKYLIYCRTNRRSGRAIQVMEVAGFTNLVQMTDGFAGWSANGLPAETK